MIRKLIAVVRDFLYKMRVLNINAYAASTAFFFFLSLVPMLILVCTILPYTPLTEQTLVHVVGDIMPEKLMPLFVWMLHEVYVKSVHCRGDCYLVSGTGRPCIDSWVKRGI